MHDLDRIGHLGEHGFVFLEYNLQLQTSATAAQPPRYVWHRTVTYDNLYVVISSEHAGMQALPLH